MVSRLGNFELVDELGGGAWGKVYLARQVTLGGRSVAVKVLWPHLAADERAQQRFLDEAHNMARLSHPNIVKVIDVGEEGGTYYFAMEYIEGESLGDFMAREGPMAPGRVAELAAQIADALGHAHSRGMVHRDIKPGNILLDAEGRPIVTDFGIAKVGEGSGLTATGMSIGTPEYMSPEQAKGNPIDGRSDIYSLGVVLYQMVCGQAPFTATTPVAVGMKHINEAPRDPRELRPDCPEWLVSIMMRALAKEPFDRFGTAQEMAARLRAARPVASPTMAMPSAAATEGTIAAPNYATSPAVTTAAVPPQVARPSRKRAVAAVAFAIVVTLGLMVGAGVLISNRASFPPPPPPTPPPLVPSVIGLQADEAEARLRETGGFSIIYNDSRHHHTYAEGIIISQHPPAGTMQEPGDAVYLVKSIGPRPAPPPVPTSEIEAAISNWIYQWENGTAETYVLACYGADAKIYSNKRWYNRQQFYKHEQDKIGVPGVTISISIGSPTIRWKDEDGIIAQATFPLTYQRYGGPGGRYRSEGMQTLEFRRDGREWKIVRDTFNKW